jgi:hypothetical protein
VDRLEEALTTFIAQVSASHQRTEAELRALKDEMIAFKS